MSQVCVMVTPYKNGVLLTIERCSLKSIAMAYQRARSPEHKEERREAILAAAHELARESSVRDVSLGDIARRVGLAKSNLLRYCESREAVFLPLLEREWEAWRRAAAAEPDAPGLARTLAERPFFCDLLGEQSAVLEHNVSGETVRAFRAASIDLVRGLAADVASTTGLADADAFEVVAAALLIAAGLYPLTNPAPHVVEIYAESPGLLQPDFEGRLRGLLETLIAGYRSGATRSGR
jgi:AcrR family transcriptional regulator